MGGGGMGGEGMSCGASRGVAGCAGITGCVGAGCGHVAACERTSDLNLLRILVLS